MRGKGRHVSKNVEMGVPINETVIKNDQIHKSGSCMVRMTMCHEPTIIMNLILYTQSQKEGGAGPASRQRRRLSRVECGQFQFLKG